MERPNKDVGLDSNKPFLVQVTTHDCGGYLVLNPYLRHSCQRDTRVGALNGAGTDRSVFVQHFSDGRTKVGCGDVDSSGLCGAVFRHKNDNERVSLERLMIKKRCGFVKDRL